MNFDLTDEQRLLRDGVERLLADSYGLAQRSAYLAEPEGWSRAQWRRFAEMGLLGLTFPSAQGGFDGGPAEVMIVMEAFGRALVVEPFLTTVILGAGFLQIGGSEEQRRTLLPRIVDGSLLLAFAQAEPQSCYDLNHVTATAKRAGDGWVINGHKRHVLGGDSADTFVVSARVAGDTGDTDGIALFLVGGAAPGVSRRGYRLQDHTRAAEVWFDGVTVGPDATIGEPGNSLGLIQRVVNRAIAAQCCEVVGVMASAYERTVEYLKLRSQFGARLGSFQALQHRAVDMFVQLELARSMAMYGITSSEDPDLADSTRAASATKVQIGRAARSIGQEAIQLHGAIGMTDEYPVGSYFRRLTMAEMQFGDTQHHLAKLARLGGLIAPTLE
ncbi:MAG: acyl-CoA dehydrogenase family protein [Sphingomonadales bacterium]|nr:acyl-CoA dehydrogenase family protein [Sphingomonadales bacterium]